MLRGTLLELKALHRVPGPWLPLALGAWVLLTWVQEPPFLRRSGTPFFWESVEAGMRFTFALLPLAWLLGRSPSAAPSLLRATRRPTRMVVISSCALIIYGLEIAIPASALGWLLDRLGGYPSTGEPWACSIGALGLLAPLAALAPGMALCRSLAGATVGWLAIVGAYALLFPWPAQLTGADTLSYILSSTLATAAGLLLSAAVVCRRIET